VEEEVRQLSRVNADVQHLESEMVNHHNLYDHHYHHHPHHRYHYYPHYLRCYLQQVLLRDKVWWIEAKVLVDVTVHVP
jgi:hypothetical protein